MSPTSYLTAPPRTSMLATDESEGQVFQPTKYNGGMNSLRRVLVLVCFLAFCVSAEPLSAPTLRLPPLAKPLQYTVDLHVFPGQAQFSGTIAIQLQILQPTSVIWLHAKSLELQTATVQASGQNQTAKVEIATGDFAALIVPQPLSTGRATVTISYTGEVSRTLTDGVFEQQWDNRKYVFTKFEPVTARRAFPCFDEPSYKVPWQLTLHIPTALRAFSNTPVLEQHEENDGTTMVRFRQTKPLPSYLVAFAVGPFETVDTGALGQNHVPGQIIVPHGRQREAAYAASVTPKLIGLLERYYGSPYPYEKLDQLVVPLTTAWGAMENAGLIAYGDFLLSPPEQDTSLTQRNRAHTMLHEMSHQWFGDLVTTAWWDDIWLNEAFASWISTKLLDEWRPDWQLQAETISSDYAMQADMLTTSRRIRQPIEKPGDIGSAFDSITYAKGSAVIGMFENYVGPTRFQQAIRLYLKQHAWMNASAADLLSALDAVAGAGVGNAFSTFLNQNGFPLVHVELRCASGAPTVQLSQERFLPVGSPGSTDSVWQTPVCFHWQDSAGEHQSCALLTQKSQSVKLPQAQGCPAWLLADANGAGFYVAAYDNKSSEQLLEHGITHVSNLERAALLRDAQLMLFSGKGNAADLFQLAQHFSSSADRVTVSQTVDLISSVREQIPDPLRPQYAHFVQSLYGERAHQLGWLAKPTDTEDAKLIRRTVVPFVAVSGDDRALQSEASRLATDWLAHHTGLDPDITPRVLAAAAQNGNKAYFDLLVSEIKKSKVLRERTWMISAVGSFRDPEIEKAALHLFFDNDIDPRELMRILYPSEPQSREIVWSFVQQNFDRLNTRLPGARGIPFGAILPLTAQGFCDASHQEQVESFFKNRIASLSGGQRNLATTLEAIHLCAARTETLAPELTQFLRKQ
jgi:cytosol alanyl aminopeptidase